MHYTIKVPTVRKSHSEVEVCTELTVTFNLFQRVKYPLT